MGDPGGQAQALDLPSLKKKFMYGAFSSLLGPFHHVKGLFPLFGVIFSMEGGGGLFSFYVEIYLDLSPLTKISAFVYAFAARIVPKILRTFSYNV